MCAAQSRNTLHQCDGTSFLASSCVPVLSLCPWRPWHRPLCCRQSTRTVTTLSMILVSAVVARLHTRAHTESDPGKDSRWKPCRPSQEVAGIGRSRRHHWHRGSYLAAQGTRMSKGHLCGPEAAKTSQNMPKHVSLTT